MDAREHAIEWRSIPGFSCYEVSREGRIRSIASKNRWGQIVQRNKPRPIKTRPNRTGYVCTSVRDDEGSGRTLLIHRAVALAFLGDPPDGKTCVGHLDGCRTNNRVENLKWVDYAENEAHKKAHGTVQIGSRSHSAKLTERQVLEMRSAHKAGTSYNKLSKKYHVSLQTTICAVTGVYWKHVRAMEVKHHGA